MQLTPPRADIAADFNITYDLSAYGTSSPIQLSYPTYQYPGTSAFSSYMSPFGPSLM